MQIESTGEGPYRMALDAEGTFVQAASTVSRGLENSSQRTGNPLRVRITSSSIPSTPLPTRITPQNQNRRSELPFTADDRDSDSSLSEYEVLDSDAETERLHISPAQHQLGMVVQHTSTSTVTATAAMAVEIPVSLEDIGKHVDGTTYDRPVHFTSGALSKKRKRDENSPLPTLTAEDPQSWKPTILPPKKRVQIPAVSEFTKEAIDSIDHYSESKHCRATHSNACSSEYAVPNGNNLHGQNHNNNVDGTATTTNTARIPDGGDEDYADQLPSAPDEDMDCAGVPDTEKDTKKQRAVEDLAEIEKIFAKLKDIIYNEKLHRVEIEMKLLHEGIHPEYVAQKKVIDDRLEEKVRLSNAQYDHAMKSLDISTHVNRAQLHSQFFQQTRQLREDTLYNCSELWYSIQRERRVGDALVSEYTFRIPDRQSSRIKQRMQFNWEVQILGGIQKQIGFPAAPDVNGATEDEKDEDFEALDITSRAVVPRATTQPSVLRLDDYECAAAHHTVPVQLSPPSTALHTAAQHQQQTHALSHAHRHYHHHHRPPTHVLQGSQYQPEQTAYYPQHFPSASSNPGPPPPSVSLLQSPSRDIVKMEPQLSQTSLPSRKITEVFSNFPAHLVQERQSPYLIGHHIHSFSLTDNIDSLSPSERLMDGRCSPTALLGRECTVEILQRGNCQTNEGKGGWIRGPLQPGGGTG